MADEIIDKSNVTAPVSYQANTIQFSSDDAIANAEARERRSTGLSRLEQKLGELKPGSPEYIKLDAKIKKKNFRREARAIKKNIRKFGKDADFSNMSTEFKNQLTAGGSVGDVARRVNKRLENFLDRDTLGDQIRGNDVNRKNILEEGLKNRDEKILEAKKKKEEQDKLIENKTNNKNNILPGVNTYFNFNRGGNFSSSLNNRTFGYNIGNYGIDYNNRGLLPGFNSYDFLNQDYSIGTTTFTSPREDLGPKKKGRPFIADANSITGGQPIGKMLKNFR
jgi:hypothetical protein|tara:strand:+ start:2726 stop:3562 length:837 start_codon:yes stop_codon:yes gene_type:complete